MEIYGVPAGDEGDGGRYGMLVETGVVMVVTMMIKQRR